jgi:hypothetical protein
MVLYGLPPSIATVRICESVKTGAVFPMNAMKVPVPKESESEQGAPTKTNLGRGKTPSPSHYWR